MEIIELIGNRNLIEKTAALYCQVFGEEPWYDDFIPEEVMAVMEVQFNYPNAIAFVAVEEGEMVGFIWLYEFFQNDLKEGTRFSPQLEFLFKGGRRVFYFQEIGVKKECRRQGIGKKLGEVVLTKVREIGVSSVVLSTHCNAEAARGLFFHLGFRNSGIVRPPKELSRTYWILDVNAD